MSKLRKVPVNRVGGEADEWKAVIEHQQDLGKAVNRMERHL